jgi:hypothetical protein
LVDAKGRRAMKIMKVFDFSDIFHYAEKHYGISWNECNDVFFNNSLEYQRHTTVYPNDWKGYVDLEMTLKNKASDYTKDEVKVMTDLDRSYVILSAYFESLGIKDNEVLVDCT